MDDPRIVFDRKAGRKRLMLGGLLAGIAVLAAVRILGVGNDPARPAPAAASPASAPVAPAFINPLLGDAASAPGRALALADVRADIFDAPDVLAAVRRAASTGSADQKGFAAEASRECWAATHVPIPIQQLMGEAAPPAAPRSDAQRLAQDEVLSRCAGFAVMPREAWVAMLNALDAQAAASTSELGRLNALIRRQALPRVAPATLGDDELQAVQAALYGDDSLLRRVAFMALLGAAEAQSPDEGSGRRADLIAALGDQTIQPSQSQLEALEALAGGPSDSAASAPDAAAAATSSASARERYRDAFARKRPLRELLSLP